MSALSILARLSRTEQDDRAVRLVDLDNVTLKALAALVDDGALVEHAPPHGGGYSYFEMTDTGQRALLVGSMSGNVVGHSGADGVERAMWTWLLLNGGEVERYDTTPKITPAVWHVLACGVDVEASGAVGDDAWTTWGGSFSDDGRQAGVSGDATCRCGTIRGLTVRAEVESVSALLRQVLVF